MVQIPNRPASKQFLSGSALVPAGRDSRPVRSSMRPGWFRTLGIVVGIGTLVAVIPTMAAPPQAPSQTAIGSGGGWARTATGTPPLNLVLLSLDTTRQDRLSCYGFSKPTTPQLDRLAAEGVLFEDAHTSVPVTLPAHASMITGQYPFEHGLRNNGSYILPPEAVTLAELLQRKGYATGAVLGAFPLDGRFGLNQGFETYDDDFPPGSAIREDETAQRSASEVTRLALEWVDQKKSQPFFLWCHYFDPHAPYRPIEPYGSKFPGDAYAAEVAAMDASIGVLLDGLRTRGLLEHSVIIVAGDHGEGCDDHGEHTHTMFIYETTQRIPFLLRVPTSGAFADARWHGARVGGLVDLTDIFPTAWNALGLPREDLPAMSGMSLLPVVTREAPAHPWAYHETLVPDLEYGASDLRGLQRGDWKYIRTPKPELYNVGKDPREGTNLAESEPERCRRMEASLDSILQRDKARAAPRAMDAETIEKLKSLGYLGGNTSAAPAPAKPDLREMRWVMKAVNEAVTQASLFRTTRALQLVDSVLAIYPKTPVAQRLRGNYLVRLGRGKEAVRAFDRALADCGGCPDEPRLKQERISALQAAGNSEEALAEVRALLQANPKTQGLNLALGEILEARGDNAGARQAFLRESEISPGEALPLVRLGNLDMAQGRLAEAERWYRRALQVNPRDADALVMLGEVMDKTGRTAEASNLTDQAIKADPANPGALMRRARDLQRKGEKSEALAAYLACLERQPKHPMLLFNLGTLYSEMGRNADAEQVYRQSIATGQAPQGAYANLGALVAGQGNLDDAIKLWEEGIRRNPSGAHIAVLRKNIDQARAAQSRKAGTTKPGPAKPGTPKPGTSTPATK